MTSCFVVFLSVALLAQVLAAPAADLAKRATNMGHSSASEGSIAVGVVEGGTFHGDAFSVAGAGTSSASKSCGIIGDIVSIFIKSACPQ